MPNDEVTPEERRRLIEAWNREMERQILEGARLAFRRYVRAVEEEARTRMTRGYAILRAEGLNRTQAITRIHQATGRSRREVEKIVSEPFDP